MVDYNMFPFNKSADQLLARHIQQSPWFPRPSEMLDRLMAGPPDQDAEAAWGVVIEQVRRVGWQGTPTFADPRIDQTLRDLGWIGIGWQDFCSSTNPEADRAHFVRWYRQAAVRTKAMANDRTTDRALEALVQRGLHWLRLARG